MVGLAGIVAVLLAIGGVAMGGLWAWLGVAVLAVATAAMWWRAEQVVADSQSRVATERRLRLTATQVPVPAETQVAEPPPTVAKPELTTAAETLTTEARETAPAVPKATELPTSPATPAAGATRKINRPDKGRGQH
jgi:hypothetical protein